MHPTRFDPDGQCLQTALDFVFSYFEDTQTSQDIIQFERGYKSVFQFLTEKGYCFAVSVPFWSLFFINYWILFFRCSKRFVSRKKYLRIKKDLLQTNKKHVVVGEDTAKRLYGLRGEYWSHFIVFYRDTHKNTLEVYDPLKPLLEKRLGQPVGSARGEDKLWLKLLIWKEPL
jgi:hypothetical protein